MASSDLRRAYHLMRAHFGHQGWWPGETPFEICVGAILTQNTSWSQVEKALENLRSRKLLHARRLFALTESQLAELIRPAGFFRVKARRLRAFLEALVIRCDGQWERLWEGTIEEARTRLLAIHGIGPETADSMLLYAGRRPTFVIDAYTIRILNRHGWCSQHPSYSDVQQWCQTALRESSRERQLDLWQDCHAQLVVVAKTYCRASQPRCELCPLRPLLPVPRDPDAGANTACVAQSNALITTAPRGGPRDRHGR
jgi:endonuclease-3 related protein